MDVVTSSVTHDMITPLKSVSCLSIQLCRKVEANEMKGVQKNLLLIYSTTQMILSGVKLLLDKRMLDKNNFLPNTFDRNEAYRSSFGDIVKTSLILMIQMLVNRKTARSISVCPSLLVFLRHFFSAYT